jgi:hypothetical protein
MATNPKAASPATTVANAVAEEVESPQHHEAPITITQFTQGTPVDVNVNDTPHPRDAHHNQSIPHPNVSDKAHELYNTFALHHDNQDDCSRLCKKSIEFSRFLFNGGPEADPSLATFINEARFDDGRDAVMISTWCDPAYTFRDGPPAKAYNTNPNMIIPIDPSLYSDLIFDDALPSPHDPGASCAQLVDHARPFFHDVHFHANSNVHPWVDLVDEYSHIHAGGGGDDGGGGGDGHDDDGEDNESNFSDDENDPEVYRKHLLKQLKKKDTVISQGLSLTRWLGGHLQMIRSKLSSFRYSVSRYARMYEKSPGDEVPPMLGYDFQAVDSLMTFYHEFKGWGECDEDVSTYCFISFFILLILLICHSYI